MSVVVLVLKIILTIFVLFGSLPLFSSLYQYTLIIFHGRYNHYKKTKPYTPNVAVLIPSWNEADVIGNTIEHLLSMDYPIERLRLYIVDDASTDNTEIIIGKKKDLYPDTIFYIKREKGGQGKAHTLNAGIDVILEDDWTEAILVIDADILFEKVTLKKMTRHLADKKVGAVMAYIKEGSTSGNMINKFIAFEYVCAQAASRRAQNVLGVMTCLAGGAQLLTKENLIAIGGKIDTTSLAEDTFTTFRTQLSGRTAVFEGNAVVWAEEPGSLQALWKQRLRWARGNIQVTKAFKHVWLNKKGAGNLGSFSFAFIWFTILLMPIFMILSSVGMIALFFLDFPFSWSLFKQFWVLNTFVDLYVILSCSIIDRETANKTRIHGIVFPGIVSLILIIISIFPGFLDHFLDMILQSCIKGDDYNDINLKTILIIFFVYLWLSLCMVVSYLAYYVEKKTGNIFWSQALLLIGGYGSFLCAITFASYIKEYRKVEAKWDKTHKTGNIKAGY